VLRPLVLQAVAHQRGGVVVGAPDQLAQRGLVGAAPDLHRVELAQPRAVQRREQLRGPLRGDDLRAAGVLAKARGEVHGVAEHLVALLHHRAEVEADADRELDLRGLRQLLHRQVHRRGGVGRGVGRRGEHHHLVGGAFHQARAARRGGLAEAELAALERLVRDLVARLLAQRAGADDGGEKDGRLAARFHARAT
jgi:hypothetical protein